MSKNPMTGSVNLKVAALSGLILLLVLAFLGLKYQGTNPDLETVIADIAKKKETLSRMRINLIKSADLEKAAVMADTDQLSRALADQASQAAAAVERDRLELSALIERDPVSSEQNLFKEFDTCWMQFRKIDEVLLEFAVENTNLKAANLSFGQGSKALEHLERSLIELADENGSGLRHTQTIRLVSAALVAAFKIQNLQAPHIAAASDEVMDELEREMQACQQIVKDSLNQLAQVLPDAAQGKLRRARTDYAAFEAVTNQVVKLSRQNSNVKSFELSLGRKRKITADCDEILSSLQTAVNSRTFEATK